MNFLKVPKLKDLRGKTKSNGKYTVYPVSVKTDIAIHHSLTTQGSSAAFANFHVGTNKWPGVAYHFVILKDGTIEWNHELGALTYHVGNSNKFAVGICLVGDFRTEEPTAEQKDSLYRLHTALKSDLPKYKRTRGHNEFPSYAWKACPEFDYRAVCTGQDVPCLRISAINPTVVYWDDMILKRGQVGRITVIKPINLWKRTPKLEKVRILQPGECYRVYGYDGLHGGQYGLGAGLWVTNMDGYIKYETPSRSKLSEMERVYGE